MSKFKLALSIIIAALMGVVSYGWFGYSQSPQPSVRLITAPPITEVLPFEAEIATLVAGNASAELAESHT